MKYSLLVFLACAFPLIAQAKPAPAAPSPLRSDIPVVPAGPKNEQRFIEIIQNAQKEFTADKSDDARKNTRIALQIAIQQFLSLTRDATDWVGTFKNRDKTDEGDLTAEIQIAPGVTITTFSTRYLDDASETLLRQNSALYNTVKDLTIGQPVTFSASLLGATISSDADMVMYPHIIARFANIDPVK